MVSCANCFPALAVLCLGYWYLVVHGQATRIASWTFAPLIDWPCIRDALADREDEVTARWLLLAWERLEGVAIVSASGLASSRRTASWMQQRH